MRLTPARIAPLLTRSALMLAAPGVLAAQGVIVGRVMIEADSTHPARPAVNAAAGLDRTRFMVRTDSSGTFVLTMLAPGEHTLHVGLVRYRPVSQSVRVADGDTVRLTVTLVSRGAEMLAPLTIDARSV